MPAASDLQQDLTACPDAEFIAQQSWSPDAPGRLKKSAAAKDVTRFVLAYRSFLEPFARRLRKRPACLPLTLLGCDPQSPHKPDSLTSLVVNEYGHPGQRSAGPARFGLGRGIANWLQTIPLSGITDPSDCALALELLLDPPIDLEADHWCRLWRLVVVSQDRLSAATGESGFRTPDEIRTGGELPLISALLLSPLNEASRRLSAAQSWLSDELLACTDTDGTPHASCIAVFRPWLAALVRAGWWGRAFGVRAFNREARRRFKDVVLRAGEMSRGDGGLVFDSSPPVPELFSLAARVAGFRKKSNAGRFLRSIAGERLKKKSKRPAPNTLPAAQSDWSACAHLRNRLSRDADLIVMLHDKPTPGIELTCLGSPVLSGPWQTHLTIAGRRPRVSSAWECTCWHSDGDGDYLELQLSEKTFQLDRQIFVSRIDHFALLMDSVRASSAAVVEYRSSIPLMPQVMARADFISREWRLQAGMVPVRVLPVSLEYDRIRSAAGTCAVDEGQLRYEITGRRAVNASLMLSWHPERHDLDAEWARLTVTESREVLGGERAAAFRVRLGDHQILAYRRLDESAQLRAVLGHHTGHETVIARLNDGGGVDPLLLVQP